MFRPPEVSLTLPELPLELLHSLYREMVRIRIFEERTAGLVEGGEIRTPTHLYIGQEAVAVGVCAALRRDDYILGNHRSHGHYLAKGGDMRALMAEIFCKVTGCSHGRGGSMHLIAPEIGLLGTVPMVAATIPIAVGAGLSAVMQESDRVAVAFFGDGATEEGTFHEAINFATLQRLPVIFVCENNFFSSHLGLLERRAGDFIDQLVAPYGIPSIRVDGNDVLAVHEIALESVERARSGGGPTFLECRTYRWRGHVGPGWDLDVGIRDKDELSAWMERCPIKTLERRMLAAGLCSEKALDQVQAEVLAEVEDSVAFARQSPSPAADALTHHVFIEPGQP